MKLKNKVAIVTGASAGIGRAYCLALAAEGAKVIAVARRLGNPSQLDDNENTLANLVASGSDLPGEIHAHVCDMASEADVEYMIDVTATNYGGIDVLINNAAVLWQLDPMDVSAEVFDQFMITNVRGPYIAAKKAAVYMRRQESGSIINITAGAAAANAHYSVMLPYAVSKAALNRLTHFLAEELKPYNIAVNSLSPGVVASESALKTDPNVLQAGTHKPATPEVLGPAIICLAQQSAQTITSQILHTDDYSKTWPANSGA